MERHVPSYRITAISLHDATNGLFSFPAHVGSWMSKHFTSPALSLASATSPSGAQGCSRLHHPRGSRGDVALQPPAPPAEGSAAPITLRHLQHCSPSSSRCVFVLSEAAPAPATTESSHQVRFAFCSHQKPSQIPGLPTTSPAPLYLLFIASTSTPCLGSSVGPCVVPSQLQTGTLGGTLGLLTKARWQWQDHASLCLPWCHYLEVLPLGSKMSALRILSLSLGLVWLCSGGKGHPWPHRDAH